MSFNCSLDDLMMIIFTSQMTLLALFFSNPFMHECHAHTVGYYLHTYFGKRPVQTTNNL